MRLKAQQRRTKAHQRHTQEHGVAIWLSSALVKHSHSASAVTRPLGHARRSQGQTFMELFSGQGLLELSGPQRGHACSQGEGQDRGQDRGWQWREALAGAGLGEGLGKGQEGLDLQKVWPQGASLQTQAEDRTPHCPVEKKENNHVCMCACVHVCGMCASEGKLKGNQRIAKGKPKGNSEESQRNIDNVASDVVTQKLKHIYFFKTNL